MQCDSQIGDCFALLLMNQCVRRSPVRPWNPRCRAAAARTGRACAAGCRGRPLHREPIRPATSTRASTRRINVDVRLPEAGGGDGASPSRAGPAAGAPMQSRSLCCGRLDLRFDLMQTVHQSGRYLLRLASHSGYLKPFGVKSATSSEEAVAVDDTRIRAAVRRVRLGASANPRLVVRHRCRPISRADDSIFFSHLPTNRHRRHWAGEPDPGRPVSSTSAVVEFLERFPGLAPRHVPRWSDPAA